MIDHCKKGEHDHRVKVPMVGVTYKFEFWNVGQIGGEKGFIFKSNYGDANSRLPIKLSKPIKWLTPIKNKTF